MFELRNKFGNSREVHDYTESFQPGLSFIPVSRAEISARPKDKILSNTASDYMTKIPARVEFQPGLRFSPV
jgi:hypothetical protein